MASIRRNDDDDQLKLPIRVVRAWRYHHRGRRVQDRADALLQEGEDATGRSCLMYSSVTNGCGLISGWHGLCEWLPAGHTFRVVFRYFGAASKVMVVCWFTRFGWLREHLPGGARAVLADGSGPICDDDFVMTSRDVLARAGRMRELPLDGHRVVLKCIDIDSSAIDNSDDFNVDDVEDLTPCTDIEHLPSDDIRNDIEWFFEMISCNASSSDFNIDRIESETQSSAIAVIDSSDIANIFDFEIDDDFAILDSP